MAFVDFKITTWERIEISDETKLPEILEKLKSGEISNSGELLEEYEDDAVFGGVMDDTSEQMSVAENDNCSTIEVYKDNDRIFANGIEDI